MADKEDEDPSGMTSDRLREILSRTDSIMGGRRRVEAVTSTLPVPPPRSSSDDDDLEDPEDLIPDSTSLGGLNVTDAGAEIWDGLRREMEKLDDDIRAEVKVSPLMKLSMVVISQLISEYKRIDDQVMDFQGVIDTSHGMGASQERGRVRDNMTQLIIERWRLLDAIHSNLHKVFNAVLKAKEKEGANSDPFAQFGEEAENE